MLTAPEERGSVVLVLCCCLGVGWGDGKDHWRDMAQSGKGTEEERAGEMNIYALPVQ